MSEYADALADFHLLPGDWARLTPWQRRLLADEFKRRAARRPAGP